MRIGRTIDVLSYWLCPGVEVRIYFGLVYALCTKWALSMNATNGGPCGFGFIAKGTASQCLTMSKCCKIVRGRGTTEVLGVIVSLSDIGFSFVVKT